MRRSRAFSPPARSAHVRVPHAPSMAQYAPPSVPPGAWSRDPRDHIAIYQPPCGRLACRELAMCWARCRCRTVFARCHLHAAQEPIATLRAAHRCEVTR